MASSRLVQVNMSERHDSNSANGNQNIMLERRWSVRACIIVEVVRLNVPHSTGTTQKHKGMRSSGLTLDIINITT
eukprot:1244865-Heterocapsa_arctica.AAC.1